ncbi:hypothetical protein WEN_00345 [Mycoplasma wenyonii str. Massachusetts]|uniref:Uncharacterized protein n=1 Tax=Mycoplasma wenyonii (strain Massachusetts) TaxID=1197325 RepID=I6YAA6_MYCWM|nr:hypothetical protein [Mycoplasma wenyonii]AFN64876.1 hypothetical protein WEN_00345 [Mycoplasma wenyonii str. Massachusetts]
MNIFFKLLAIGGVGGSIGGIAYLSQQEYTNVHAGAVVEKKESQIGDGGVDVKKQPGEKAPATEARQGQNGASSGGGGSSGATSSSSESS